MQFFVKINLVHWITYGAQQRTGPYPEINFRSLEVILRSFEGRLEGQSSIFLQAQRS